MAVLRKSAQIGTDCGAKMLDKREGNFAKAACGSPYSVKLAVTVAKMLLLFLASESLEKRPREFSTVKGRSSFSFMLMRTENANFLHA